MKNMIKIFCIAISLILFNCKDDKPLVEPTDEVETPNNDNGNEPPDNQSNITIVNSDAQTQTVFANQANAAGVIFVTTGSWTSRITEGVDEWIAFSPTWGSGSGERTVSISLKPNITGSERTAVFTIRCGGEEEDISITQTAVDRHGNPYPYQSNDGSIEEYLSRDWETVFQTARQQALAEDRTPLDVVPIHKLLFVACTNVSLNGVKYLMDESQKQFVTEVAQNFKEIVEYWSNYNVVIEADILFIDREVEMPDNNPTMVPHSSIWQDLDIYAPIGAYDGIIVTAARNTPNVHFGVKIAGYEHLYGYAWYQLIFPNPDYTIPKDGGEMPFLASARLAIHEWLHKLEFLGGFLDYSYPNVHGYQYPELGYDTYINSWEHYRATIGGNVRFAPPGGTVRRIGMFPAMWKLSPRFLCSKAIYIVNEDNGLYLAYSDDTWTRFSTTPHPWYLRYNGNDGYLIVTNDNRTVSLSVNAYSEGASVIVFRVNLEYPEAQTWRIGLNNDGTYRITTQTSNRVLQANTVSSGTSTTINTDNGGSNQKWRIVNEPL